MNLRRLLSLCLCSLLLVIIARGEGPITIDVPVRTRPADFESEILPILRANCIACHNAKKDSGSLNLESAAAILKGGKNGPAVVPGKSSESLLLKLAAHQQKPMMPPTENKVKAKQLTPAGLGLIKLWIDQGASAGISANR